MISKPVPAIAARLKALREQAGLSQRALAELAGISQGCLSNIEAGRRPKVEAETLLRLAEALGVAPRELLPRSDTAHKRG